MKERNTRKSATLQTPPDKQKLKEDGIFNDHNVRLQCGLIFLNMTDAIKEGDGKRLVRCYEIILLFEYKFKYIKYAYALQIFFCKKLCFFFWERGLFDC